MGPLIIRLGKNTKWHLSHSDLFHLPCCALSSVLYASRRGTHALVERNRIHGKNLLVVGFQSLCEPHSCGPQENRTCCRKTQSAVGLAKLFPAENTPSNQSSHTGAESMIWELKAKKLHWELNSEEREKEDMERDQRINDTIVWQTIKELPCGYLSHYAMSTIWKQGTELYHLSLTLYIVSAVRQMNWFLKEQERE